MRKIIKNTMIEPIETECEYCKSTFSFNYEDIRREERNVFMNTQIARYVICPVCKEENPMSKIDINKKAESELSSEKESEG